jgi:hypothetical protein
MGNSRAGHPSMLAKTLAPQDDGDTVTVHPVPLHQRRFVPHRFVLRRALQ